MNNNVIYKNVKIIKNHMSEIQKDSKLYLHLEQEIHEMLLHLDNTVAAVLTVDILMNKVHLN